MSTSTVSPGSVSKLSVNASLTNAVSAGIISSATASAIDGDLDDIAIAGCAGVDIDDIDSEDVTLVVVCIDGSLSMNPFRDDVIKSYSEKFLDSLKKASNAESLLVSLLIFSGSSVNLVHGYTPVTECKDLTHDDYNPRGMTPLYEAAFKSQIGIVSYGQVLRDSGTRVKMIVVMMSDGGENASHVSGSKVRKLSGDLLRVNECIQSYIFFGNPNEPDDQNRIDGDAAADDIGFPLAHRLTRNLDAHAIRDVFGQVSASVITTSQAMVSADGISNNPFFSTGSISKPFGLDINP